MKTKRTKWQEWERRVEAWRSSGEPASTFAERNGWNARTLTWWATQGLRARRAVIAAAADSVKFVEVAPEREVPSRAGVVDVVLRNGRRLRIRGVVDPETLGALARVLDV
jgi:hypothetical protein